MGAEADAGPVGGLLRVREGVAVLDERGDEFVREVWMRAAVAGALREGQVLVLVQIVNAFGGEHADRFRQAFAVVRHFHAPGNFSFGFFGGMHDGLFAFDELPFEGFFAAVDIEALAVLARGVEERAINARAEVRILEFDVRAFDGERGIVFGNELFANAAGAEA